MNVPLLALTAVPFVLSPGASFTLTVSAAARGDRAAGATVWAGTAAGVSVIAAVASSTNLDSLVARHHLARLLLGMVGGVVLVAMGVAAASRAVRTNAQLDDRPGSAASLLVWAFLAVVLNAKAVTLYLVVVPTLSRTGAAGPGLYATFAALHLTMLLAWLGLVSLAIRALPRLGASPGLRRGLMLVTALTLVLLGVRSLLTAGAW